MDPNQDRHRAVRRWRRRRAYLWFPEGIDSHGYGGGASGGLHGARSSTLDLGLSCQVRCACRIHAKSRKFASGIGVGVTVFDSRRGRGASHGLGITFTFTARSESDAFADFL